MLSAVDSLLTRLKMPEAIPKFKDMKVDRIVALRRLSEEDISKAVPDVEKRQQLLQAINSRGMNDNRAHHPTTSVNPPRNAEDAGRKGGWSSHQGSTRNSAGGNRGMGRMHGDRPGNSSANSERHNQACHHFFSGECKYGDNCHFSHDQEVFAREQADGGPRRRPVEVGNTEDFSAVVEIPFFYLSHLVSKKTGHLKRIHRECNTHNRPFPHADENSKKVELTLYGPDLESVEKAKKMITDFVGAKRDEERKTRSAYALNELEMNWHSVKLLAACNIKNEGNPREISENSLRSIISSFRFEKRQDVRHFWVKAFKERNKLDIISKIISQLQGVQAIMFCEQSRVIEMSNSLTKISRHFNGVNPVFIYPKVNREERLALLEEFAEGEENKNGIRERLMVTSDDYAKLARKITIPYVNVVVNYSLPRSEEFYQLQSHVVGRNDTVGVSILCVSSHEMTKFEALKQNVKFEELRDECDISEVASLLSYEKASK